MPEETPKICEEFCFHYDPEMKGCSYLRADFYGEEKVEFGEPCLHPEWDKSQLLHTSLENLCDALSGIPLNFTETNSK